MQQTPEVAKMKFYARINSQNLGRRIEEVTLEQIVQALDAGEVLLVYGYDIHGNISPYLDLTGREPWDDRGKGPSCYDETYSLRPKTFVECIRASLNSWRNNVQEDQMYLTDRQILAKCLIAEVIAEEKRRSEGAE